MKPLVQATFAAPPDLTVLADEPLIVHRRTHERENDALVVFVHGLGGSRYGDKATWGYFPQFLYEDLPQVDVGLYGYTTLFGRFKLGRSIPLEDEAEIFAQQIRDDLRYPTIILAGHSMGGLLCMAAITYLANYAEKSLQRIGGLILMATPQFGSLRVPPALSWLSPDFYALRRHGPFVRQIQDTFAHRLVLNETSHEPDHAAIPTWALAGASDFWVDRLSATATLPPARRKLVRGSHASIVKPRDKETDAYRRVREWTESCLARAATAAVATSPNPPMLQEARGDTIFQLPRPDLPPVPRISIARLPATGGAFVAREEELGRLDAAWEDGTNVISFIAEGGAGKSVLVRRWLGRLQQDGWRGAERVFGWSFYRESTKAAGASSEAFTTEVLNWLGYRGEAITSPWKRGEVLADLTRETRTILVLDGLEPLQHPPGAQTGWIKDPSVQALVGSLATANPGLCIITTRVSVADIAGQEGTEAIDLDKLPAMAGAELLRRLGVKKGSEEQLRAASEEVKGHALALTLLGTYLRDVCGGDIRRRSEAVLLDEAIEGGEHARKVMASYENWFGPGAELQMLHLLGLFDRLAEFKALAALRAEPEIPGLTEGIGAGKEREWNLALARLRRARLVTAAEDRDTQDTGTLDAHPLVREYFGARLRESAPEAWRAGNERLYEHYQKAAPEFPETVEAMLPLYAAVVHGCRAGREQEALEDVYWRRINRGTEFFSTNQLGAFGAELTALAAFFDRPWDRPSDRLTAANQAWLLHQAGFRLRALGRLPEAVQPMRAGLDGNIADKDWRQAAISASNLSELTLTLGDVAGALAASEESVELADRSGNAAQRMLRRTTLANALHAAGRWEESTAAFREAEAMQAESQPKYPRLYSLRGYQYCDLLLGQAEPEDGAGLEEVRARYREVCEEVRDRAREAIEWESRMHGAPVLDFALHDLSLGRAHLGLALTAPAAPPRDFRPAADHLDRAVDGLRKAGTEHNLPRGLLARAALRRLAFDFPAATADLREAQEIAERGSMRLHEADAHLERTRLHLTTGDLPAARRHLDRAAELVHACGYGRREREVAWLERRLAESPG